MSPSNHPVAPDSREPATSGPAPASATQRAAPSDTAAAPDSEAAAPQSLATATGKRAAEPATVTHAGQPKASSTPMPGDRQRLTPETAAAALAAATLTSSPAARALLFAERTLGPLRKWRRRTFGPGPDAFAATLMDPRDTIAPLVAGRSVALVGNAQSLIVGPRFAIDDHDVVVRIKRGPLVAQKVGTIGRRTDILLMSGLRHARELSVDLKRLPDPPRHLVFMDHENRKYLPARLARSYAVYPIDWWHALHAELGAMPSTGAMGIDLLSRLVGPAGALHLYGFDFFQTPSSHSARHTKGAHVGGSEEAFALRQVGSANIHRST